MNELKSCPFCGADLILSTNVSDCVYHKLENNCKLAGQVFEIEWWNTRALDPRPLKAEVKDERDFTPFVSD